MKTISLGYTPREWQRQCHLGLKRFNVLVLHRRAGKTQLALMQLLDRAANSTLELAMYGYVAPYLKQAKQIAWARLKTLARGLIEHGVVEVFDSELSIRFVHNGAVVRLFGADNADSMRGLRFDGVVVDEVAQVAPQVWDEVIQPALADRKGWAVFIGTVSGVDLFSQLYFAAQNSPDWFTALFTVYDTDTLDPDEIARLKASMSAEAFAREFLCDFGAGGDDQLISMGEAMDASQRVVQEQDYSFSPIILGVDVARQGKDRTVIFRRQGWQSFEPIILAGANNMKVAAVVAEEIGKHNPQAVFIDVGGGGGVIDRLRQLGFSVVEVNFGSSAFSSRFKNRRTEMWWGMREWLRSGGAIPSQPLLRQELATPKFWHDAVGKVVLEPKDEIKKRLHGGASPDLADALALTFAAPVAAVDPREEAGLALRRPSNLDSYNPFSTL